MLRLLIHRLAKMEGYKSTFQVIEILQEMLSEAGHTRIRLYCWDLAFDIDRVWSRLTTCMQNYIETLPFEVG